MSSSAVDTEYRFAPNAHPDGDLRVSDAIFYAPEYLRAALRLAVIATEVEQAGILSGTAANMVLEFLRANAVFDGNVIDPEKEIQELYSYLTTYLPEPQE